MRKAELALEPGTGNRAGLFFWLLAGQYYSGSTFPQLVNK